MEQIMTGLRARLAATLQQHRSVSSHGGVLCICDQWKWSPGHNWYDHLADVLLSLPGIAIVDQDDIKFAFSSPHLGYDRYRSAISRLVAAANKAEETP